MRKNEKGSAILVFTSIAHFINDGGLFLVPIIFAILTSAGNVSSSTIAVLPVVFYGASLFLSVYVGNISDRTKRQGALMGIGLVMLSFGLIGFALSMAYATGAALELFLLISAFLAGLGAAFYHSIGAAVLQAVYYDNTMGKALGINGSMGSLGRALYPSIFFAAAAFLTENGAIVALALAGAAASVMVSVGLGKSSSPSAGGGANMSNSPPTGYRGAIRERVTMPLIMLTLVAFISAFATQGIGAWIPTYLAIQSGLGISTSLGLALSGMYLTSILGQPLFGYLVDRYDKRLVLGLSIIGSALSIVGFLLTSGLINAVLLGLLGLFTFSGFPIFLSIASEYVPKKASSLSNALVWSLGVNGGGVVGPAVIGAVALSGASSWPFAFGVAAAMAFISALMVLLLPKSSKNLFAPEKL
ncbi:MAG: MFS transporter [Candidatus Methanosuratincola sp.]|nr:MFS transporter [Candidatus Methanosuratincola sp.]